MNPEPAAGGSAVTAELIAAARRLSLRTLPPGVKIFLSKQGCHVLQLARAALRVAAFASGCSLNEPP